MLKLNGQDTDANPSSIVKSFIFHKALEVQSGHQWIKLPDDCKMISNLIEFLRQKFNIAESVEFSLFMENSRLRPQSSTQVLRGSPAPVMVMPTFIGMEWIRNGETGAYSPQKWIINSTSNQSSDTSSIATDMPVDDDFKTSALNTTVKPLPVDSAWEKSEPDSETRATDPKTRDTSQQTESGLYIYSNPSQMVSPHRPTNVTNQVENSDSVIVDASTLKSIAAASSDMGIDMQKSPEWFISDSDYDDFDFSKSHPSTKLNKKVGTGSTLITSGNRSRSTSAGRKRSTSGSRKRTTSETSAVRQATSNKKRGSDANYRPVNYSEIETGSWIRFSRRASASKSDKKTYRRNYVVMDTEANGTFKALAVSKEGKPFSGPKSSKNPQTFKWSEIKDVELHIDDRDNDYILAKWMNRAL